MKLSLDNLTASYEIFLKNKLQETDNSTKPNQLLSFCFKAPNDFFTEDFLFLLNDFSDDFYSCADGKELSAFGNIFSLQAEGADRWELIEELYKEFPEPLFNSNEPFFIDSPLFCAAVKFSDEKKSAEWSNFNNIEFYIPKLIIKVEQKSFLFRFNDLVTPTFSIIEAKNEFSATVHKIFIGGKARNDEAVIEYKNSVDLIAEKDAWNSKIEMALSAITNNSLTKIVLARKMSFTSNAPIPLQALPGRLKRTNPSANIFFIKKNDTVFLGASPEILIEVKNNTLRTEAIAGSRRRGTTLDGDSAFEKELFDSNKERAEHSSVVEFLVTNLTELTSEVRYNKTPTVKKLTSIQHLSTEITAILKEGSSLFGVIKNIFPTPAVCGFPKEKAMQLISELEDFDRGLYTGLVGWISPSSARLIVAIRSALINKNTIFVYAGCGIVEGSNPESEFAETETKFKTILSAFNEKS
ncbi:MAG: isochorismate synthase [Ignavibacteria bacterium]|nr:isochorismate synthase [Ignavibacteria bacterium]